MLLCSMLEINDVVLYCIVLYCIVLYCIVLKCITPLEPQTRVLNESFNILQCTTDEINNKKSMLVIMGEFDEKLGNYQNEDGQWKHWNI